MSLIERENTKWQRRIMQTIPNTLPEQEFNFIVSDVRIPRMVPLQTLADESGISYKALWHMCKQNKIVHIKSGNKFLVNVDTFNLSFSIPAKRRLRAMTKRATQHKSNTPVEWEQAEGFSKRYLISTDGQVYSIDNDKILKPDRNSSGYVRVPLYNDENEY